MPLVLINIGEKVVIKKIGGNDETKKFLENLGFVVGSNITIISKTNGNLILNVKDSRIALGENIAKKIIVAN